MPPAAVAAAPLAEGMLGGLGSGILAGGSAAAIPGIEAMLPAAIPAFSYAPAMSGITAGGLGGGSSIFDMASSALGYGKQAYSGLQTIQDINKTLGPQGGGGAPGEKGSPAAMSQRQGVGSFKPQQKAAEIMGQQELSANPLASLSTDLRHQLISAMLQGIG